MSSTALAQNRAPASCRPTPGVRQCPRRSRSFERRCPPCPDETFLVLLTPGVAPMFRFAALAAVAAVACLLAVPGTTGADDTTLNVKVGDKFPNVPLAA